MVSGVTCQVSNVRSHISGQVSFVPCQVSGVMRHRSQDREGKRDSKIPPTSNVSCVFCLLLGVQCQVSGLGVRCHLSSVRCQVSSLRCQGSPVNYNLSEKAKARATDPPSSQVSCVTCHVSGIMCQVSCVRYQVSHVSCHMSGVTCQVPHVVESCVTCHL